MLRYQEALRRPSSLLVSSNTSSTRRTRPLHSHVTSSLPPTFGFNFARNVKHPRMDHETQIRHFRSVTTRATTRRRLPRTYTVTHWIHDVGTMRRLCMSASFSASDVKFGQTSERFQHLQHLQKRCFSDNLLGYSPMSQAVPRSTPKTTSTPEAKNPGTSGPSWGVDSNTAGGGIWAQTSARQDKLRELKSELPNTDSDKPMTLDDAATSEQKLDLHLAEGLGLISRAVDENWKGVSLAAGDGVDGTVDGKGWWSKLDDWMNSASLSGTEELADTATDADDSTVFLDRDAFESYLASLSDKVESLCAPTNLELRKSARLDLIRDYAILEDKGEEKSEGEDGIQKEEESAAIDSAESTAEEHDAMQMQSCFDGCTDLYRAMLTKSAITELRNRYDDLIAVSDGDVDRAAVAGETVPQPEGVSRQKLNQVIGAFATGTMRERTAALWQLYDRDNDGLVEQVEMNTIIDTSIKPVEDAMLVLLGEALEAAPTRSMEGVEMEGGGGFKGWRKRRQEAKTKKKLRKTFQKTVKHHFEVNVETPHRLRCIYAWAEKVHQDNRIESVLVSARANADGPGGGGDDLAGGKQRYVELHPKISFEEFLSIQKDIFPHFDRIGSEIGSGFKDDLLLQQGRGRQNQELKRECAVFLLIVSIVDVAILSL